MSTPEPPTRGVPRTYVHATKEVSVGAPVCLGDALLKWYEIAPADAAVPAEIASHARAFVTSSDVLRNLALGDELGFVILHRCGAEFYFLLVSVWRGANEVWEAVYHRDGSDPSFRPFGPANPGMGRPLRPTFCVWELGVVHHEATAWRRYLESRRTERDVTEWQGTLTSGPV